MTTKKIRGVDVCFPFEPYQLQVDYMEKVLECLQNSTNGVLESPTGTGKTLSLLCSSLAWLQLKKAQVQLQNQTPKFGEDDDYMDSLKNQLEQGTGKGNPMTSRSFLGLPKIYYASRTHSQLLQAMQELKRTAYSHMSASVLGSREQMCIHPELINETNNSLKTQMCRIKVKTRSCQFYNKVEQKKGEPDLSKNTIIDIEDIVKVGTCHKFCPYYMAKHLQKQADIVFLPYNYLLDVQTRKALGVELAGNIIILDEAHNVEKICEESASLQIKSSDIAVATREVTVAMTKIANQESLDFDEAPKDITEEDLSSLKEMLLHFENEIDKINPKLANQHGGTSNEFTLDGTYAFEMFNNIGVNDHTLQKVISTIDNVIEFLSLDRSELATKGNSLQLFVDFIKIVFCDKMTQEFKDKIKKCYKLHVMEEKIKKKTAGGWQTKMPTNNDTKGKILNYWCFSPGFGMNMLKNQNLKCIILTSGTLAPLKPLISELELDVPVQLENPHIVDGRQICVKIVKQGPDMQTLNCSFNNRENPQFIGSIGRSILNLTRVIPDGILIFFPSYPIMIKFQDFWQKSGLWNDICSQKEILVEPKEKLAFNSAMSAYYKHINMPNSKGAIFMGVCRGKVSEGLDFADANGRAVIIVGLPYPPFKDPRVVLKKNYLNICNAQDKQFLKGDEWYGLEATRAINQAIGRVIRHKHDYGAIILMDERFDNCRIKNQLSKWLRDHIRVTRGFGEVMKDVRMFFKNAESLPKTIKKLESLEYSKTEPKVDLTEERLKSLYRGNFDFGTSNVFEAGSSKRDNPNGEIRIQGKMQENPPKRRKINLMPNKNTNTQIQLPSGKEYIAMIRKSLDASSFTIFHNALKLYKQNKDFGVLTKSLDEIFISRHSSRYLIQGLENFINREDKGDFQNYCDLMR